MVLHTAQHGHVAHSHRPINDHLKAKHKAANTPLPTDDDDQLAERFQQATIGQQSSASSAATALLAQAKPMVRPKQSVEGEGQSLEEAEMDDDGFASAAGEEDDEDLKDTLAVPDGRVLCTEPRAWTPGRHLPEPVLPPSSYRKDHRSNRRDHLKEYELDNFLNHGTSHLDESVAYMAQESISTDEMALGALTLSAHVQQEIGTLTSRVRALEHHVDTTTAASMYLTGVSRTNPLELESWLYQVFPDLLVSVESRVQGLPPSTWVLRMRGSSCVNQAMATWKGLSSFPSSLERARLQKATSFTGMLKERVRRSLTKAWSVAASNSTPDRSTRVPAMETIFKDQHFCALRLLSDVSNIMVCSFFDKTFSTCTLFVKLHRADYNVFVRAFLEHMRLLSDCSMEELPLSMHIYRFSPSRKFPCIEPVATQHAATTRRLTLAEQTRQPQQQQQQQQHIEPMKGGGRGLVQQGHFEKSGGKHGKKGGGFKSSFSGGKGGGKWPLPKGGGRPW